MPMRLRDGRFYLPLDTPNMILRDGKSVDKILAHIYNNVEPPKQSLKRRGRPIRTYSTNTEDSKAEPEGTVEHWGDKEIPAGIKRESKCLTFFRELKASSPFVAWLLDNIVALMNFLHLSWLLNCAIDFINDAALFIEVDVRFTFL